MKRWGVVASAAALLTAPLLGASAPVESLQQPSVLDGVRFDQRLDSLLPLDTMFRDENGKSVELGSYFGTKPVILVPVYYECPMLCTLTLNGLLRSLRALSLTAGKDFEVVAYSFNPRETPDLAAAKKKTYVQGYGRIGGDKGWHFLTGDQPAIDRVSNAIGFKAVWDEARKEYAHASGLIVATPQGKVSHYFYGAEYPTNDLRLSLVEASHEKIGNVTDKFLLYCFHYDPSSGRYSLMIMRVVRIAALFTMAILGFSIALMTVRDRRRRRSSTTSV